MIFGVTPSDCLTDADRDIHNTKYICPQDLKAEHDRWLNKVNLMEEKRRNRERMERAKRHEADFYKNKSCFFGIVIRDNDIEISVLDSLEAYKAEGEKMKHCVFQCEYYAKTDTVILSGTRPTRQPYRNRRVLTHRRKSGAKPWRVQLQYGIP